ncbi:unnamed protein product [Penicillium camemberti]|uniref:Str. FM013 n=1 Tax=Penicillium camemberti (strain FM 013) TaxID=1429867 RepID=A0A0G4PQD5_PENC3|nr:unnamed protein product [Penicillium camemberti]
MFFCGYSLAAPVPLAHRGNDDGVVVEFLPLAFEKGAGTALKIGGVVLLFIVLRDLFAFFFWWLRLEVSRARGKPDE